MKKRYSEVEKKKYIKQFNGLLKKGLSKRKAIQNLEPSLKTLENWIKEAERPSKIRELKKLLRDAKRQYNENPLAKLVPFSKHKGLMYSVFLQMIFLKTGSFKKALKLMNEIGFNVDKEMNKLRNDYREKAICYIDILGYKEMLKEDYFLYIIKEAINNVKTQVDSANTITKLVNHFNLEEWYVPSLINHIVISDGILLYTEMDYLSVLNLIKAIKSLINHFINYGILLRGCITLGKIYFEDNLLFSPGFVDAYINESKKAKYPRVIFSESVINYLTSNKTITNANSKSNPYREEINAKACMDFDRLYFVDNLDEFVNDEDENNLGFIKDLLIMKMQKSQDQNIIDKIHWYINYFNRKIEKIKNAQLKEKLHIKISWQDRNLKIKKVFLD